MTAFASAARRSRYIPLELKLPLLMIALLSAAVAVTVWASYGEVRRALRQSARSRVEHAAQALATTLERDAASRLGRIRDAAADPGLAAYLSGGVGMESAAVAVLDRLTEATDSLVRAVILSRDGSPLLWSQSDAEAGAAAPDELSAAMAAAPADGGYGPIFWKRGQASVWATVPVMSAHEQIGWVAQLHVLDTELQALARDSMIAGPAVRLASTPGALWSTLAGEPMPAPAAWPFTGARDYEHSTGEPQLAHATEIGGTAWSVVAEIAANDIRTRVWSFVWRIAVIAAGVVLIAGTAAWLLGRKLTRSIRRLHFAARAIAAGNHGEHVMVRRGGELGGLAATLNDAITQVQSRRRELEVQHGEARELAAELVRQNAALEERLAAETTGGDQAQRTRGATHEQLASGAHEIHTPAPLEPRVALLEVAVATVLDTVRPQAASKGIVITDTCGCDSTTFYFGDPKRVEQIVMNLVTHAVEATPAAGRIHIECHASAEDETPSSQVVIESVTGEGSRFVLHLPPAAQRVDSATTRSIIA